MAKDLLHICSGYGGGIKGVLLTVTDKDDIEDSLTKRVLLHDWWIDLYGSTLRAAGVDVIRRDDGTRVVRLRENRLALLLESVNPFSEEETAGIRSLRRAALDEGASCLFVPVPRKTCAEQTAYCLRGITDRAEEIQRSRTDVFRSAGYPVLDLHARMHEEGLSHPELYFRTDHHWLGSTALWAAGVLAQELGIPAEKLDPAQFDTETHPHFFLGSEGKNFGSLYCGTDDFSIPIPRYATHLTVRTGGSTARTGDFDKAALFREFLQYDPLHANVYCVYLGLDRAFTSIENHDLPHGRRVLLIKDSYANSMGPYLALVCGQLDMIDPREFKGSIPQFVREGDYDTVVIALSAGIDNSFFSFGEE